MRKNSFVASSIILAASAALTACGGGGGGGYSVPSNPIVINSNALPNTLSGQPVSYCLPFSGGSGGPYILEVIDGTLPKGVSLDSQTVCLVGQALEDGVFDFRLKLTDTGSQPFTTTTEDFHWVIGIGSLVYGTDAVLPPFVYNRFDSIILTVAGGVPPYSCEVVDDPANPQDELLPTGLSIPPDSTTIVGAPTGVKPGAAPFTYKVSVKARDHADDPFFPNPATVVKEFTITVLIPEILITTTSLPDGKCGQVYSDRVEVLDGIPPFLHRIVPAINSQVVLAGDINSMPVPLAGLPGGMVKGVEGCAYAAENVAGPYTAKFPEGMYLREGSGDVVGLPRRAGVFNQWVYWVQSTALPALDTQNKWRAFSFTMADSVPPAVALDPSFMLPGQGFTPPSNLLGTMELDVTKSVQFLATGGCPGDGYCDAPHEGQRIALPSEALFQYNWTGSGLVAVAGEPDLAAMGLSLTTTGLFSGTPVVRSGFRTINLQVTDFQLPTPLSAQHTATGSLRFDIGPDSVIVTESTVGNVNSTKGMIYSGTANDVSYEYNSVDVEVWEPFGSGSAVRPLDDEKDLALTHTLPAGESLAELFNDVDLMSITVNPTWWAYDGYNVNTRAARGMQGGQSQRALSGMTLGGDMRTYYFYYQPLMYNLGQETYERFADTCIELPRVATVGHNPTQGIYADGGQMYGFENADYFGVFVIRKDSKIYVPFAMHKADSGFTGFGDAVVTSDRTLSSVFRRPQITVSPDGRYAAAKLKVDVNNFVETCASERVVFFTLTGEKAFSGQTYRLTDNTGGAQSSSDGLYMYGSSFALTDRYLYLLKGNNFGSASTTDHNVTYRDHWVYRCDILSGNPALLAGPAGTWTNAAGSPLCVPFQRWAPPNASQITPSYSTYGPSEGITLVNSAATSSSKSPPDAFGFHWANFGENSAAPMPFRVSADGKTCAILAAPLATSSVSGSANFLSFYIFADYDTAGLKLAGNLRRYNPPTRLSGSRAGDQRTKYWGWYTGPATQLEISDDGKAIGAVFNAFTGAWYGTGNSYPGYSNYYQAGTNEDLLVARGTGGLSDPWASRSELTPTVNRFEGGIQWRYGNLHWTRDNLALVFWGGCALIGSTRYEPGYTPGSPGNYVWAGRWSGTLYQYTPGSDKLESILPTNDGGSTDGVKTLTTSTRALNDAAPGDGSGSQGGINPTGSFVSNDGNFFWTESLGALAASGDATSQRLVGVNVKSSDPASVANTINARAPLRAFAPTWPVGRGWGPSGAYYPTTNPGYQVTPNAAFGMVTTRASSRVGTNISVSGTNGVVYFMSYWQANGGTYASFYYDAQTVPYYGGGPTNPTWWDDYANCSADLFVMDTSKGSGPVRLTNLGEAQATIRHMPYIRPSRSGTSVAFLTAPAILNYYYMTDISAASETLRIVSGVNFTATGALANPVSLTTVEGSAGRAGTSMSFDYTGTKLYYAFKSGATSENQMELVESTLNPAGAGVLLRRTQGGLLAPTARFSVLHSGR
jgi:hypothetical protein